MITPYSSFANRNKALRQEYPVPISAQGNVVRENLEFYDDYSDQPWLGYDSYSDQPWLGPGTGSTSSGGGGIDLGSVLKIVDTATSVYNTVSSATKKTKTAGQQLNTPTGGNSGGGGTPQGPQQKAFLDGKTLAIGGGVLFVIVVILILKLKG